MANFIRVFCAPRCGRVTGKKFFGNRGNERSASSGKGRLEEVANALVQRDGPRSAGGGRREVGAKEQHDGFAIVSLAFNLGQCPQLLPRKAFRKERQKIRD